ncbi:MAG: hypothetical protein EOP06_00560 [Proteobacteria bacterium]|nr:MAG: hypothetical protein EOP06_00560 [Pseudomonadota bacterium]
MHFGLMASSGLYVACLPPEHTVKWATGYKTAIGSITNDAKLVRDFTVGDTTTWVPSAVGGTISVLWDLLTPQPMTQIVSRIGYVGGITWALEASNNGTTWVDAIDGLTPAFTSHSGSMSYETIDVTTVATPYRYWRLSLQDSGIASNPGDPGEI